MKIAKKGLVSLFIMLCTLTSIFAQPNIIQVNDAGKYTSIDARVSVLQHPNIETIKIEDIYKSDSLFKPNEWQTATLGDWTGQTSWYKIVLDNQTQEKLYLSVLPAVTDTFEVYTKINGQWDVVNTGRLMPFNGFNISPPSQILELKCAKNQPQVFYIHVKAFITFRIRMSIAGKDLLITDSQTTTFYNSLSIGLSFLVCLQSIFFFFIHRRRIYSLYAFFTMSLLTVAFYYTGYFNTLFFRDNYLIHKFSPLLLNTPTLFALLLCFIFFERPLKKSTKYLLGTVLSILILNFFIGCFYSLAACIWIVYLFSMPITITAMVLSYRSSKKTGNEANRFFLWGFSVFMGYLVLYFIDDLGIFPQFSLSPNLVVHAIAIEALLLLFAMLGHINDFKKAKETADAQLIESLETQQRYSDEHKTLLEKEVQERTSTLTKTLSELEQKEEELNVYADKLKRSNGELVDFASIISHDLKAPLRNTTSFVQLLVRRNKDKFDDTDKEYANFIVNSSNQSVKLVDDLLNYSKLDKNIGEPQSTDFTEIVGNACVTLRDLMIKRNVSISLEIMPDIQTHRSLIVMLMQNLINNGIKYNDSETPEVKIGHFKNLKKEDVFYVQDNGIGISAKYQEEVFKMFRRLNTKNTYEGTGIGLAFCKRIIDFYKGRIWFESTEGAGTTFFFTLPDATNVQLQSSDLIHV
jgi:signal transduction histidine kinase